MPRGLYAIYDRASLGGDRLDDAASVLTQTVICVQPRPSAGFGARDHRIKPGLE